MVDYRTQPKKAKKEEEALAPLSNMWESVFEPRVHRPFTIQHYAEAVSTSAQTSFNADTGAVNMFIETPPGVMYVPTMLLFHEQGHIEFDSPSHVKMADKVFENHEKMAKGSIKHFFNIVDDVVIDRKYATSYYGYVEGNKEVLDREPLDMTNKTMIMLSDIRINTPEKNPDVLEIAQLADAYIASRSDDDYIRLSRKIADYVKDENDKENTEKNKEKSEKKEQESSSDSDGQPGQPNLSNEQLDDTLDSPVKVNPAEFDKAIAETRKQELVKHDETTERIFEEARKMKLQETTTSLGGHRIGPLFNDSTNIQIRVMPYNDIMDTHQLYRDWLAINNEYVRKPVVGDLPELRKEIQTAIKNFQLTSKRKSRGGVFSSRAYIHAKYNNPNAPMFRSRAKTPLGRGKFLLVMDSSGSMYIDYPGLQGPMSPHPLNIRFAYIFLSELSKQLKDKGAKVEEVSFTDDMHHGLVVSDTAGNFTDIDMLKYFKDKVDQGYTIIMVTDEVDKPQPNTVSIFRSLDNSIGTKNSALILTTDKGGDMFGGLKHAHRVKIVDKKSISVALKELQKMLEEKYT